MVNIGVIGAGHLGKIHLKLLKQSPKFRLIGFFDSDPVNAALVAEELGVLAFDKPEDLIDACDAIDIVTPTLHHFDYALKAVRASSHIFIEKPVTTTIEEARKLVSLVNEARVKAQVGHVERFNPAFLAAKSYFGQPLFIETHRLAEFNPRGTDVSVVHDLMIHDIDIVLSVVKSEVRKISASGVAVVSDSPDIANARIEFSNGCIANLTASRISLKNMRKTRFFQRDAYISVDFFKKKTEVVRLKNLEGEPGPLDVSIDLGAGKGKKLIYFDQPTVEDSNAIGMELDLFADSIMNDSPTAVTVEEGMAALHVAHQVNDKIQASLNTIT
ncbi:MAG: Gfo/Idh/MocA family protein, partial [Bacteroidota bacterium]